AVTAYATSHAVNSPTAQKLAFLHGYHVSFFWGAVLLAAALVVAFTVINAKKQDVPSDEVALVA
ncbi:MAG TPA: hypothetical protein VNC85_10855, partial [Mycobacteriales bacterium]|nr:hypothetical protein [Mycobacteriales bacterium]